MRCEETKCPHPQMPTILSTTSFNQVGCTRWRQASGHVSQHRAKIWHLCCHRLETGHEKKKNMRPCLFGKRGWDTLRDTSGNPDLFSRKHVPRPRWKNCWWWTLESAWVLKKHLGIDGFRNLTILLAIGFGGGLRMIFLMWWTRLSEWSIKVFARISQRSWSIHLDTPGAYCW